MFAQHRGVTRLMDNSKHIYINWQALLTKRTFDPRMNPWQWARRDIEYDLDMCARTLDILGRSCRINLGEQYPSLMMYRYAKRLAR